MTACQQWWRPVALPPAPPLGIFLDTFARAPGAVNGTAANTGQVWANSADDDFPLVITASGLARNPAQLQAGAAEASILTVGTFTAGQHPAGWTTQLVMRARPALAGPAHPTLDVVVETRYDLFDGSDLYLWGAWVRDTILAGTTTVTREVLGVDESTSYSLAVPTGAELTVNISIQSPEPVLSFTAAPDTDSVTMVTAQPAPLPADTYFAYITVQSLGVQSGVTLPDDFHVVASLSVTELA